MALERAEEAAEEEDVVEVANLTYDAFLCYATKPDYDLVRRFQSFAEAIHTRMGDGKDTTPRALKLCLDGTDFARAQIEGELSAELVAAIAGLHDPKRRLVAERLARARSLIVFCSGSQHHTEWMEWEIRWFREHVQREIWIAVTSGRDPWATPDEAFPRQVLAAKLHEGGFGYDLRGLRGRAAKSWHKVRDPVEEMVRIAADLHSKNQRELFVLRWERAQRRRVRWVAMIAVAVAAAMLVLSIIALVLRHRANEARADAERRSRVAESRQLAAQAALVVDRPLHAIDVARQSLRVTTQAGEPPTRASEQALRDALARAGGIAMTGHTAPVRALATSSDGAWLLTGSSDRRAALWNLQIDESVPTFLEHGAEVTWVAFAGTNPVTVGGNSVRIWSAGGAGTVETATMRSTIHSVTISPSGAWLAIVDDEGRTRLLNVRGGSRDVGTGLHATRATFTRDERWVVVYSNFERGNDQGAAITAQTNALAYALGDPAADPVALVGHRGRISSVAAAPEPLPPSVILSSSADGRVLRWDLATSPPDVSVLPHATGETIEAVDFSANGEFAIAGTQGGVGVLWRVDESGAPVAPAVELHGHDSRVNAITTSADGRWLITAGTRDAFVRVWDLTADRPESTGQTLGGHKEDVEQMLFVPKVPPTIVTTSSDKTARVWRLGPDGRWNSTATLAGHDDPVRAAVTTPDGRRLFVATGTVLATDPHTDPHVRTWWLDAPQPSTFPHLLGTRRSFATGEVSDDGRNIVAVDKQRGLVMHELVFASSEIRSSMLGGVDDNLSSLHFTSSGTRVVAVAEDGVISLWDRNAQGVWGRTTLAKHPYALLRAAIAPDELTIAAGDNESGGAIWPLAGGAPIPFGASNGTSALAYRPDGKLLAIGDGDGGVHLVRPVNGTSTKLDQLPAHIDSVAFSPDGRWLVAVPDNPHPGRLWKVADDGTVEPPLVLLHAGEHSIELAQFSTNSRSLAWVSGDSVYVLRLGALLPTKLPSRKTSQILAMTYVADDAIAIGRGSGEIEVWRLGAPPVLIRDLRHIDRITAITRIDDTRFAAASEDGAIRLWDLAPGDDAIPIVLRPPDRRSVQWLKVRGHGRWLAAGTLDGVALYPVTLDDLLTAANRTAPES